MIRNPDWGRPALSCLYLFVHNAKAHLVLKSHPMIQWYSMLLLSRQFPSYQYYDIQTLLPVHLTWPHTQHVGLSGCNVESWWQISQEKFWPKPFPLEWKSMMSKSALVIWDSDIKWREQSGRNLPNWLVLEIGWSIIRFSQMLQVVNPCARVVDMWWIKQPFNNRVQRCWDAEAFQDFPGPMNFLGHAAFFGTVWSQLYNYSSLRSKDFQASEIWLKWKIPRVGDTMVPYQVSGVHYCWWSISPTIRQKLGGGNSNIFGIFTPKIGEDEPNLTSIFFRWVGSTTNYFTLMDGSVENGSTKNERKRSNIVDTPSETAELRFWEEGIKDFFLKNIP